MIYWLILVAFEFSAANMNLHNRLKIERSKYELGPRLLVYTFLKSVFHYCIGVTLIIFDHLI